MCIISSAYFTFRGGKLAEYNTLTAYMYGSHQILTIRDTQNYCQFRNKRRKFIVSNDVIPIVLVFVCTGCGSASHIGVISNTPTIGVAKKLHFFSGMESEAEIKSKFQGLAEKGDKFTILDASRTRKLCNVSTQSLSFLYESHW